jgi:RNA polymerase-associated protein CTR9
LAKAEYEADEVKEAIKTVSKALHIAPTDHRLRFNVAYLMQQAGAKVLQQNEFAGGDDGRVEAYQGAALAFENSHRIFMHLQQLGQVVTGIATKKLEHHVGFASEMHKSAIVKLSAAEKEAAAASLRRNEQQLRKKAADKVKELEMKRRNAEAEAEESRRQEIARQTEEHLRNLKDAWKRGATIDKAVAEGDISGIAQKPVENQDDALDAYFANLSDDDDDYVPGQEKNDPQHPPPAAGDDEEELDPLKAAGLLSSSDEDEDFNPEQDKNAEKRGRDPDDDGPNSKKTRKVIESDSE